MTDGHTQMENCPSEGSKGIKDGSSFLWLNVTQFFGALNDNVFKLLLFYFIVSAETNGLDVDSLAARAESVMALLGAVFVLPFLLFSHAGGVLADRFSKRRIAVFCKVAEVGIMMGGCVAFGLHNVPLAYGMLFAMAWQSAIFGPAKYGIIPELVHRERLSKANSLIVMCTFMAIIFGMPLAAGLSSQIASYEKAGMACVLIAILGLLSVLRIDHTPAMGRKTSFTPFFFVEIFRTVRTVSKDRELILAVLGSAFFMLLGAFIQMDIAPYGMKHLMWSKENSTYLFLFVALGIGAGSMLAGVISGRNIEFGIVPIGMFGMAITSALMYPLSLQDSSFLPSLSWMTSIENGADNLVISGSVVLLSVNLFFMGFFGGMFLVPLNAFIQYRVDSSKLGEVLAANSFMGFLGVLLASLILQVFGLLGLEPGESFLAIGVLAAMLAVISICLLPDFLVRFFGLIVTRLLYRIRVSGLQNLPSEGAAVLLPNHVTWMDALFLSATTQRRIRFVMYRDFYEKRWLNPLLRLMGTIPISVDDSPKDMIRSLKAARAALDDGFIVCIFAEGSLTRNGMMRSFLPGFEYIVKQSDYPLVPAYISGGWGSIFSYFNGQILGRWFTKLPYPIDLCYGAPLPSTAKAHEVRQAVRDLGAGAACVINKDLSNLGRCFVRTARKNWGRRFLMDSSGKAYTFGEGLIGALCIGHILHPTLSGQEKVGVLLPASATGSLVNIALILRGYIPVNLNFTGSKENIEHAIQQCELKTVISSRVFLEQLNGIDAPDGCVYMEDVAPQISGPLQARMFVRARFQSVNSLVGALSEGGDSLATVIFSSGSTGVPKGVMLTHHNIITNVRAVSDVFRISPEDSLCSALPLFHSFGFTATLWLPAISGFSACYHSNPLDGKVIAEMVRTHKSTILLSTPTFLMAYIRRAKPEDFASLRCVAVGAEKLKKKVADSFESRFGLRPHEGYGATELSPVVSFNVPNVSAGNRTQVGVKEGSIGHPLPSVSVQIVDVDTREPLSVGSEGLMLVKGPNVMKGYLNDPERTAEVIRDGWYDTGDIARMDEDGFLTITDRLARFSKIAGEMVSHVAIEDVYMLAIDSSNSVLLVVSVPDDRKGEKLVVLYTDEAGDADSLQAIMAAADVPNLWKPRRECYLRIDELPMLGTGKLDLKGAALTAAKMCEGIQK